MPTTPIATIIIPTYNRTDALRRTLDQISRLDRVAEVEVLVFDDASHQDDTPQLRREFPHVTFLRAQVNQGQSHARNLMLRRARAEFVLGLDDDSWFTHPDAIIRAIEVFRQRPDAGLLSFRIRWADGRVVPDNGEHAVRPARTFIGCGFAIRKSVADRVGGFLSLLRRQGEEQELSLRVLGAGYEILHVPDIEVFHLETEEGRDHQAHHALAFRNELLTITLRYPLTAGLTALPKALLSHGRFCLRNRWFRAYRRGLLTFFQHASWAVRNRQPVTTYTLNRYRQFSRR